MTELYLLLAFLFVVFVHVTYQWFLDLRFYWHQKWDFSKDRKGAFMGLGVEGDMRFPISNSARVLVGYPIIIILVSLFLIVTVIKVVSLN